MSDLIKLTILRGRGVTILEETAVYYRDIGTILLKDDTGAIVKGIAQSALGDPVEAMRRIYEKWLQKDENHSWQKLAKCFRNVQLNSLASDIEQHYGLPLEGIISNRQSSKMVHSDEHGITNTV